MASSKDTTPTEEKGDTKMKTITKKIATAIMNADSIKAILAIIDKMIDMMECDCFSKFAYTELFALACIKAIAIGEFDKLMFEYPFRCKMFLATHGWDWDVIDDYYSDHHWSTFNQCYYAKRAFHEAEKRGIA